jgi:hypothetical protein
VLHSEVADEEVAIPFEVGQVSTDSKEVIVLDVGGRCVAIPFEVGQVSTHTGGLK